MLGMGVPIPMLVLFGSTGAMVHGGALEQGEALLLVFTATLLGDILSYTIFYYGGPPLLQRVARRFAIQQEYLDQVQAWYRRYGIFAYIVSRWINWGEGQMVWLCGLTHMPFWRFFPVVGAMDFLWSAAWTYLGIGSLGLLARLAPWAGGLLATLLVVGAILAYNYYRRHLQFRLAADPPPGEGEPERPRQS